MKKLLFGLIATVLLSNFSFGQSQNKKIYKSCVTVSCCGIGPFSIDVWSETTCHYISYKMASGNNLTHMIKFETKESVETVTVPEDVILAGMFDDKGENLLLPKGEYKVENNTISFAPVSYAGKKYCYIRHSHGTIFGYDYDIIIGGCITLGKSGKALITITPELTDKQKGEVVKNGNILELLNDITIGEKGVEYTIKAGKYILNEDGNAYIQNVQLNK